MRKLWPPTYDDCSVRLWAIASSFIFNLLFFLLAWLNPATQGLYIFFIPGMIFAMTAGALSGGEAGGSVIVVISAVIGLLANLGFYYLVSWVFINMFRPATNWWPEKRS